MAKPYKVHDEPLNGNRKLINRVKKAGIKTYNPQGKWNGYGYEKLPMVARIETLGEMRLFNKIKKELAEEPQKPKKTDEEKKLAWAKSLVNKLKGTEYEIDLEDALDIADEKIEYKYEKIAEMVERQNERYSEKRESLINKMYRENPLRRVESESHAISIMIAHGRHSHSIYDSLLEEYHELESDGLVIKGKAKEFALRAKDMDYEEIYELLEEYKF